MNTSDKTKLHTVVADYLGSGGDHMAVDDDEPLFSSGRLDSLAMTRMVMHLEDSFGIDFAAIDFEISLIDSIAAIECLVDHVQAARP